MINDIYIFKNLLDDLCSGRKIEFTFRNSDYSITNTNYSIGDSEDINKNPYWQFDNNTEKRIKLFVDLKKLIS